MAGNTGSAGYCGGTVERKVYVGLDKPLAEASDEELEALAGELFDAINAGREQQPRTE